MFIVGTTCYILSLAGSCYRNFVVNLRVEIWDISPTLGDRYIV